MLVVSHALIDGDKTKLRKLNEGNSNFLINNSAKVSTIIDKTKELSIETITIFTRVTGNLSICRRMLSR